METLSTILLCVASALLIINLGLMVRRQFTTPSPASLVKVIREEYGKFAKEAVALFKMDYKKGDDAINHPGPASQAH